MDSALRGARLMYTHCPDCCAELSVDAATLARGGGKVECPECAAVFNALLRLAEVASTPNPPSASLPAGIDVPEQPGLFDSGASPPPFAIARTASEGTQTRRRMIGVCALLALLLGAQIGLAAHQSRIEHRLVRQALIELCRPFGCQPLPRRDTDALALVSRDVRQHPDADGALLITASLANRSNTPVALPVIEIVLSDLSERRIAMRRFRPFEYAPEEGLERRGLAPGSVLPVAFEVEDPGRDAVAFSFSFH